MLSHGSVPASSSMLVGLYLLYFCTFSNKKILIFTVEAQAAVAI